MEHQASGAKWDAPYVKVNGVQVWTANFTFQQMQALGRMHDRNRRIAITATVIGILAICLSVVALIVH